MPGSCSIPLSVIWLLFVTGVGMLIHIYSIGYMAHEGGYYRFFGYLNLFMFSMLTLILANNYAMLFVGWEGVGLCSYLLIGFYFLRTFRQYGSQQGFHREPHRRRRLHAGHVHHHLVLRDRCASRHDAAARSGQFAVGDPIMMGATLMLLIGACGKVGADSALRLAAGRDGRPHAGFRADPCRDHGHGGRLHGGAQQRSVHRSHRRP